MYTRHTCLFISREGRERILREMPDTPGMAQLLLPECYPPAIARHAHVREITVPGIVRREENTPRPGYIPVGFSSWRQDNGQKLRIAAFVAPHEIRMAISPDKILHSLRQGYIYDRTTTLCALSTLVQYESHAFSLGVWGSAAMELLTGYFYTREDSDLDLWLQLSPTATPEPVLQHVINIICEYEALFHIRIDAELALPSGYGISVKEFFDSGSTVLAKGLNDVMLLQKRDLFAADKAA